LEELKKQSERELRAMEQKRAEEQAAKERQAAIDAELQRLGSARRKAAEDRYRAALIGKIRGEIVLTKAVQGNPVSEFRITQLPTGDVLDVKIIKSSGNKALDEAVERAIRKSSPLPLPDDRSLFQRELNLKYWPRDE
jgi:colicin import membrane protein